MKAACLASETRPISTVFGDEEGSIHPGEASTASEASQWILALLEPSLPAFWLPLATWTRLMVAEAVVHTSIVLAFILLKSKALDFRVSEIIMLVFMALQIIALEFRILALILLAMVILDLILWRSKLFSPVQQSLIISWDGLPEG